MPTPQTSGESPRKQPALRPKRTENNIPFERIPGLAYTHEEQVAAVLEALEDYRAGRTISNEEMGKWINSLQ
jgi:predicted transcriptional regulator